MKSKRGSKGRKVEKPAVVPTALPLEVTQRLIALLEALLRQIRPELSKRAAAKRECPRTAHEALARVELDGFLYVLSRTPARQPHKPLSPRELEVARFVAQGLESKQIARKLRIQVSTVDTHLRRIRRKLGIVRREVLAQEFLLLS